MCQVHCQPPLIRARVPAPGGNTSPLDSKLANLNQYRVGLRAASPAPEINNILAQTAQLGAQ